jgi:predicted SAM-dependent methyltransferase
MEIVPPHLDDTYAAETRDNLVRSYLSRIKETATVALNLGCGDHPKPGYLNCDLFNPDAEIQVDIRRVSTKIKSADLIESHHAIEHLSGADAIIALKDWIGILKKGGYLIISAPDLEACMIKFLESSEEERWSSVINMIYGSQEHEGMFHKTGFTSKRMAEILDQLGMERTLLVTSFPPPPPPSFLYVGKKV